MPLRRRWALAMLCAAVGWMAGGAVCAGGGSSVPVQFRNPDDLGVGKLLVASRGMGDDSFAGTVILLVRFDAERGVQGLVLNRRTDVPISEVTGNAGCFCQVDDCCATTSLSTHLSV